MGVTYLITLVILVFRFLLPAHAQGEFIVGGTSTTAESLPWQLYVNVYKKVDNKLGRYVCGGSTISLSWCMSAAHCFAETGGSKGFTVTAERIILYAGVTNQLDRDSDPNVQKRQFEEEDFKNHVFIHPEYGMGSEYNNDITIIKLKEPWIQTDTVRPILMATLDDFIVPKELTVSGWGRTSKDGPLPKYLQKVSGLNLITREKCKEYWDPKGYPITDTMICQKTEDKNTCSGDSGGPVITGSGKSNGPPYVQIGIVSWGSSNCAAYVPKVFVEVAKFKTWIGETIVCPGGFFRTGSLWRGCYKLFNDRYRNWIEAKEKCEAEKLIMARPLDPVSVRLHLVEVMGIERWVHIGARGDSTDIRWLSNGQVISRNSPLWAPGQPTAASFNTNVGLNLMSSKEALRDSPNQPFFPAPVPWEQYTLCQIPMYFTIQQE